MNVIQNKTFDMERALYGSRNIKVQDCRFDGPADGRAPLRKAPMCGLSAAFSTCAILSGMIMGWKSTVLR